MTKPSNFHPDLKEEDIIKVAQLITSAYEEAVDHMLEDKGDTNWGLGCRRYEWARQNIRLAAGTFYHPYLKILEDDGNKFTFLIGGVPVRFKRGESENMDKKVFAQYRVEAAQLSLLTFSGISDPCELSWRMVMEVDALGEVIRAVFIGANEHGVAKCFWEVPHTKLRAAPVAVLNEKDDGVDLAPAKVGFKTAKKKKDNQ